MPPPPGVLDDAERARLVQLAQAFESAADAALASEKAR